MTYLLTEIALGILGNKFYDINGVPNYPNFQESSFKQGEVLNDEATLQELLGLEESVKKVNEIKLSESSESRPAMKEATIAVETINTNEDTSAQALFSASSKTKNQQSVAATSTLPARKLNKLLRYEHERLRKQVRRNKPQHIALWAEQSKRERMEKRFENLTYDFKYKERERLLKDLRIMLEFRKVTERKVCKLNEHTFNKYKKTFED